MKRLIGPVLAVVLVVVAALAIHSYLSDDRATATLLVEEVRGEAGVTGPDHDGATALRIGMELGERDRVATGEDASAVLSTGEGARIRLEPSTAVRVEAVDNRGIQLELENGLVKAEVRHSAGTLRIGAGATEFAASDADFAVSMADDRVVAQTTRGEVMVAGVHNADRLGEGARLTVAPDGTSTTGEIPTDLLLAVEWPTQRRTRSENVTVHGTTEPHATVEVRFHTEVLAVVADSQGMFSAAVALAEGENLVSIQATNAMGDVAPTDEVVLERDTTPPSLQGAIEFGP
jgi:hypothetical protein